MSTLDKLVKAIHKECLKGKISVPDAVAKIDIAVGGISQVNFNAAKHTFTIKGAGDPVSLQAEGICKRKMKKVYGLAAMAYVRAQENGNPEPGKVEISATASTKHHIDGFYRIVAKYAAQVA